MAKDRWDKAEIISKIGGAILIPVVLGLWGVLWNNRFQDEQAASARIELAMAILTKPALENGSDDAIRGWAVSVLQSPTDPPEFPDRGEVLLGYIAQDSAICGALKDVLDDASLAILENSEDVPDEVISSVVRLIVGLDAGCDFRKPPIAYESK